MVLALSLASARLDPHSKMGTRCLTSPHDILIDTVNILASRNGDRARNSSPSIPSLGHDIRLSWQWALRSGQVSPIGPHGLCWLEVSGMRGFLDLIDTL